jgi:hypothetical protein
VKLPRTQPPPDALAHVKHRVRGDQITVTLPERLYDRVNTGKYQAQMLPNARLAGLLSKDETDEERRLVPFLFAEVHLPRAPTGKAPHLRSRLPERHWVFCWDARRSTGYLLITPRPRDEKEIRFHVDWAG